MKMIAHQVVRRERAVAVPRGPKAGLAADATERGRDIGTLAVLKQHNHNQNYTDDHVDQGYQSGNPFQSGKSFQTYGAEGGI